MHEYSIASSLLRMAEEHAAKRGAERVVAIEVSIGELSGVEIELLETAWSLVRERSLCDGVDLGVQRTAARWVCRSCEADIERGGLLSCGACGGTVRLVSGDELVLERIEMEVS
jgi:hydrogenase nickel incorporation protein HypA/HybF